jgi:SAM-dependent methyltransferase
MTNRKANRTQSRDGEAVQAFYDLHPYPPPVEDLDRYRQRWQDETRRRAEFHLHWPDRVYRTDLKVLIAGCGTSQAAKHAIRQPASQVVGIDISQTSLEHTEALKSKYKLSNLEVYQLPVEQAGELGCRFDKIVCTGVLHHLSDPEAGLRSLCTVLEPDGAIHLMVYAAYGRAAIYMLQDYCRKLGIGHTDQEIQDLAVTLAALPPQHPLGYLLSESPDFQSKAGLADALLHPQDRAFSVPQLFDLITHCGLRFSRWVRQAPYLPQCGSLSSTPHAARLAALSPREQYAAVELFRGTMLRHSLIVHRDEHSGELPHFIGDEWLAYVPIRLPESISVQKRVPQGAAGVLINQSHSDADLVLPVNAAELQLFEAIDGKRSIGKILQQSSAAGPSFYQQRELARVFFERIWQHDLVVFDISLKGDKTDE